MCKEMISDLSYGNFCCDSPKTMVESGMVIPVPIAEMTEHTRKKRWSFVVYVNILWQDY